MSDKYLRYQSGKEGTEMVRHIILWKLKESYAEDEKRELLMKIKTGLEELKKEVSEIMDIRVHINGLDTSNADLMLESSFESAEKLAAYAIHPSHVKVAENLVKPFMEVRMCFDFEA